MNKILILILFFNFSFSKTGLELATLMEKRLKPKDIQSKNTMILIDSKKRSKTLELISKSKDNSQRQMIWFLSPADDKGMAFLKIEYDDKDDLMKMWLPAFKKFRRIASSKKTDSFMGSDLSFEDLTNRNLNDYEYKIITNEDTCSYKDTNMICYKLLSTPINIESEYSKHYTWVIEIEENIFIAIKEHSFNKKNELLKTKDIEFDKIDLYYIMNKLFVNNIEKQSSTSLIVNNISLDLGFENEMFKESNLKRLP